MSCDTCVFLYLLGKNASPQCLRPCSGNMHRQVYNCASPVAIWICRLKSLIQGHDKAPIWLGGVPAFLVKLLMCVGFLPTLWSGVATELLRGNPISPGCQEGWQSSKVLSYAATLKICCCQSKTKPGKNISARRLSFDFVFHPQKRLSLHLLCLSLIEFSGGVCFLPRLCAFHVSLQAHWEENETAPNCTHGMKLSDAHVVAINLFLKVRGTHCYLN